MVNQMRLPRFPILLSLLACAWAGVYSAELKPGLHAVFGIGNTDFVATLRAIESPRNRWKPGEEPLPVDMAECARKAKQHLLRQRPEIPSTANLLSAEIAPFTITLSNRAGKPQHSEKNQEIAWYLVFTFSNQLPNEKQAAWEDCTVGMMLNGTFLEPIKKGGAIFLSVNLAGSN